MALLLFINGPTDVQQDRLRGVFGQTCVNGSLNNSVRIVPQMRYLIASPRAAEMAFEMIFLSWALFNTDSAMLNTSVA